MDSFKVFWNASPSLSKSVASSKDKVKVDLTSIGTTGTCTTFQGAVCNACIQQIGKALRSLRRLNILERHCTSTSAGPVVELMLVVVISTSLTLAPGPSTSAMDSFKVSWNASPSLSKPVASSKDKIKVDYTSIGTTGTCTTSVLESTVSGTSASSKPLSDAFSLRAAFKAPFVTLASSISSMRSAFSAVPHS